MNLVCSVMDVCAFKDFTPGRELRQHSLCEAPCSQPPSILQLSEVSVFGCMAFIPASCVFHYNPLLKKKLQSERQPSQAEIMVPP